MYIYKEHRSFVQYVTTLWNSVIRRIDELPVPDPRCPRNLHRAITGMRKLKFEFCVFLEWPINMQTLAAGKVLSKFAHLNEFYSKIAPQQYCNSLETTTLFQLHWQCFCADESIYNPTWIYIEIVRAWVTGDGYQSRIYSSAKTWRS